MRKYYFTFGQSHVHSVNGITFDKDIVVEITANNSGEARDIMFDTFGDKWCFEYKKLPDMSFFPRGIIKLN